MILTCPSCSAKYKVDPDSIGKKGRTVRCASCKHEWFQKSEKDTLDDLISRIQAEEFDEIGFQEHKNKPVTKEARKIPGLSGLFAKIAAFRALLNVRLFRILTSLKDGLRKLTKLLPENKQDVKKLFGGVFAATLTFAILGGGVLLSHNRITQVFPDTEEFFNSFGLRHRPVPINYNEALALDRVEYIRAEKGRGPDILRGVMINLSTKEIRLPSLEIKRLDEKGDVLHTQLHTLSKEKIETEGQIDLQIVMAEIPADPAHSGAAKKARKIEIFYLPPPEPETPEEGGSGDGNGGLPVPHTGETQQDHTSSAGHDIPKPFEGVPSSQTPPSHNKH